MQLRLPRRVVAHNIWGFPKIRGTFLGLPYNKDYSIPGSTLGSPYSGQLPYVRNTMHGCHLAFAKQVVVGKVYGASNSALNPKTLNPKP